MVNLDNVQLGGDFTEEMMFTGFHNISTMTMSFRVQCSPGFCGPGCMTTPTNNQLVAQCQPNGSITCINKRRDPLTFVPCGDCLHNLDIVTNCSTCLEANYDPDTNCQTCLLDFDITTNCSLCTNRKYDPVTICESCINFNFNSLDGCISCVMEFYNPQTNCTQCLPNRDLGTNCTQCLPNRDPATNCTQCVSNYDINTLCTQCLSGYNISSDCTICLTGFNQTSTGCIAQCLPGSNCDNGKPTEKVQCTRLYYNSLTSDTFLPLFLLFSIC